MIVKNIDNDYLITHEENQYFDRKSARIKPSDIARHLVAFANANGGILAIGIEDNGTISGFKYSGAHSINEFEEIPYNLTGIVNITSEVRIIEDKKVLLFEIQSSDNSVIKTSDGKIYLRVGDQSKQLNHEQVTQLEYDKGERHFEDLIIQDTSLNDINVDLITKYKEILKTPLSIQEILDARSLMKKGCLTYAGILLFGKHPTKYLPNARVRIIKYDGNKMETGKRLNIIKDINFESCLPLLIDEVKREMNSQLRDFQYLDDTGTFKTIPEYPEFSWLEGIVNAVTHRNYSLQGDCIRISMYDDRIENSIKALRRKNLVKFEGNRSAGGYVIKNN